LKRTVYSRVSRLQLNDYLMQHDYPDPNAHNARRAVTITPLQKLYALNDEFVLEQARTFARRLIKDSNSQPRERIQNGYRLAFGRDPTEQELQLAEQFIMKESKSTLSRWEQFAQALLISNEMLYVD
jgi:hypothetical protein